MLQSMPAAGYPAEDIPKITLPQVRGFLSRKSELERAFELRLNEAFVRISEPGRKSRKQGRIGHKNQAQSLEDRISQYALVDDAQMNLQVLVTKGSLSMMQTCGAAMAELDLRLQHVLCHRVNLLVSPASPRVVADCFTDALLAADIMDEVRQPVLALFLKCLCERFPELLSRINQAFVQRGILPEIDQDEAALHAREVQEEAQALERRESLIEAIAGEEASSGRVSVDKLFAGLDELIRKAEADVGLRNHVAEVDEDLPPIGQDDLMLLLAQLPLPEFGGPDDDYPELTAPEGTLIQEITHAVEATGKTLEARWANCLSMVSLLFEKLDEEGSISPVMLAVVNGLRVPFARAAVLDETFFADTDNPAQDLFNMITRAGATWTPAPRRRRDSLFNKLSTLVYQVARDFIDDYTVFSAALDDLDLFLHAERRRARLVEERIIAAEKARARTEGARRDARQHVYRVFGEPLPEGDLGEFLGTVWEQILFFLLNQNLGKDDELWQLAMELETQMLCFEAAADQGLPDELSSGLNRLYDATGLDEWRRQRWQGRLAAALVRSATTGEDEPAAVPPSAATSPRETPSVAKSASAGPVNADSAEAEAESSGGKPGETAVSETTTTAAETPVTQTEPADMRPEALAEPEPQPDKRVIAEEILAVVDRLNMGAWLQQGQGESANKLRIGAYIRPTETFVFVNRAGNKVGQMHRLELAEALQDGEYRLLDTGMMFERALESVVKTLRA